MQIYSSTVKLTLRHSLALLRQQLGKMTQKELAELAGCKRTSIQAIELGKLKLSPKLTHRISRATGANYSWLLEGNPSKPPINDHGQPYSEADFQLAQDEDLRRLSTYHSQRGRLELAQAYYFLRRTVDRISKDPLALSFFLHRLEHFVRAEIGKDRILADQIYAERSNYPPKTFLSPQDTKSCDVMQRDAEENRLTVEGYLKEISSQIGKLNVPAPGRRKSSRDR
jgi:transcriptional regulator with XRE-family HTH domain